MANLPGEVCTRPPTCQGHCAQLKAFGQFLAGGLCFDGLRKGAAKAAVSAAKAIGSKGAETYILGLPSYGCGELYGMAADYMYKNGDSFIECHPAPSSAPPGK